MHSIRNLDFIKENQEKTLKINANYLLNHLILNYQERRGVYYSFIKAYDTLYNGNLYNQVNNYLKTLSIYFRMYTILATLQEEVASIYDYPELTDNARAQIFMIKALSFQKSMESLRSRRLKFYVYHAKCYGK